jgi:hypothetical protein
MDLAVRAFSMHDGRKAEVLVIKHHVRKKYGTTDNPAYS